VKKFFFKRHLVTFATASLLLSGCLGNSPEQFLVAAKLDIEKKNNGAAIIQLKNALQKNPSLPEARFLLGQLLLESGDVGGAVIEFGKAEELGFSTDKLVPKLGQTLLIQGKFDKIVADYGQLKLQSSQDMSDLQTSLASAYAALGKPMLARERVELAIAADPSNIRAQLIRGRLMVASDGVKKALTALEVVLNQSPNSADAWQLKGELLSYSGQIDLGIKAFQQAVQLDKNNIVAHTAALSLLMSKGDIDGAKKQLAALRAAKPRHPQTLYFTAAVALGQGDMKQADENIQALLKAAPEDVRVLHLAGALESQRGGLLQAEFLLNKALSKAPDMVKVRVLLAQTYVRSGNTEKAITLLQPLLGEQSTNAEALGLAAEAYLQQGESKRAQDYFTRVIKLDPKNARSRTALAKEQVSRGNVDQGMADLHLISGASANPIADMTLISVYLQKGDTDQALKAIDVLEVKTPGKPAAANLRGRVELTRGNKEKARLAFEAALAINPLFYSAAASLAGLDWDAKQPDAAMSRFKKILSVDPKHVLANMAVVALRERGGASKDELAEMLVKITKEMPSEAAPRLNLVRLQIARKDPTLALAAAQDAVAALPDNIDVRMLLGEVQAAAGDLNQASIAFNKVIAMQPNSPEPHLRLAEISMLKKDSVAAGLSLKRALSAKADFLPAQTALVALELAEGKVTDALAVAKTVQTQRSGEYIGYELKGDIDGRQKNWGAAAQSYRVALTKAPVASIAIKLHNALRNEKLLLDAATFENEWILSNPKDTLFLHYLGDLAAVKKDYSGAQEKFLEVIKIEPNNALATNNLAWVMYKSGKSGAVEYAEKANKIMPNQPPLMDSWAEILADQGLTAKAVEVQKQAVGLAPDNATYRLHLAKYYLMAGQNSPARNELNKLVTLGGKFNQQDEVKRLLGKL
jgi:putative PEP-CTERM system TPR-repeat lipoprotein